MDQLYKFRNYLIVIAGAIVCCFGNTVAGLPIALIGAFFIMFDLDYPGNDHV
jgi:hypothetical protein